MKQVKHVLMCAAGTGGHVIPALTVAEELRQAGMKVSWLGGSGQRMEHRLVPAAGFELYSLPQLYGLRGRKWFSHVLTPFRLFSMLLASIRLLRKLKPDCVMSMGGYVSGPAGVAAYLLKIPLIVHEQNAIPGTTNRILVHFASQVYQAYPRCFAAKLHPKTIGNPIRPTLLKEIPAKTAKVAGTRLHILVLGGSQGAKRLNDVCPETFSALQQLDKAPIRIWHQTGERDENSVRQAYQRLGMNAQVSAFIDDMNRAYSFADLVIARAGALTLAELCAVGLPSILIPYPHAIDDHQTKNAEFLQQQGAAILLPDSACDPQHLFTVLQQLQQNPVQLQRMADAALELKSTQAAMHLKQACMETMT